MGVVVFIEYLVFGSFIWESLGYMINGQITINVELSSKQNKSAVQWWKILSPIK